MSKKQPWLIQSRKSRWSEGKTHYATDVKDLLGLHESLCGTTSGGRFRGPHKDVDCKRCIKSKEANDG